MAARDTSAVAEQRFFWAGCRFFAAEGSFGVVACDQSFGGVPG